MHRTEGSGYILEGGLRRFTETPPGSSVPAEWMNAVQEEIANVLVAANVTIKATAALDRSANWDQMAEAIFSSEAIDTAALADDAVTDDKISDCDVSKLTYDAAFGGADLEHISGGVTYNLTIKANNLALTRSEGVLEDSVVLTTNGIEITHLDSGSVDDYAVFESSGVNVSHWTSYLITGYTTAFNPFDGFTNFWMSGSSVFSSATLKYSGLQFIDNGTSSGDPVKCASFSFDGVTWTGSSPYYGTITSTLHGNNKPLMAQFSWRVVSSGITHVANSNNFSTVYDYTFTPNGSYWDIQVAVPLDLNGATYDRRKLLVWYE